MKKSTNLTGALKTLTSLILPAYKDCQVEVFKAIFFGLQPYLELNGKSYDEGEDNFLSLLGIVSSENTQPIFWTGSIQELQLFLYIALLGRNACMDNLNTAFRYQNRKGEWVVPKFSANREANLDKMFSKQKIAEKNSIVNIFNNALGDVSYQIVGTDKYPGSIKIVKI